MRIALAQIISSPDPDRNLDQVAEQVARAAQEGVELVIFPEATMRCFGRSLVEIAEAVDGPWATRVRQIAERHEVAVIAGMFTPAGDGRVRNTLLVAGTEAEAHYDKIHLFDAYGFRESDTVAPGVDPVVVRVGDVSVGLTTCYDVRFPGLFTRLAADGAQLICVCASWGAGPGKVEQWKLLCRARALDATTFVAACGQADPAANGVAFSSGAPTGVGYSAVISPEGEVLAGLGPDPGQLIVDVDLSALDRVRRTLPVLANRRF